MVTPQRETSRAPFRLALGLSLGATLIIGAAHLHYPFMGDQALFSVFGRMLDDGAVLYRDAWDVKQPGIFAFYWLAGRLLGFSEVGAHAFELAYLGGFSLVLAQILRARYRTAWLAAIIPFVLVGWFYAVARITYLTQVETLVGPLLFGSVWLMWKGGTSRYLWAGVLGALVLFLKLIFLPLLVGLWLLALHESGGIRLRLPRAVWASGIGLVAVLAPFVAYVAANDVMGRVWWTFVTYPPQVLDLAGRSMGRLIEASAKFALLFLPFVLLAPYGAWVKRHDSFVRILSAWVVGGAITYLLQLWWGYLLLLVLVPLVLLALEGLDDLLSTSRRRRGLAIGVLLLASVPAVGALGLKGLDLVQHGFGVGGSLTDYQEAVSGDYGPIRDDVAQLEGIDLSTIYVIGDPLYLFLEGLEPAIAINGWSPEYWNDQLWREVNSGLRSERPTVVLITEDGAALARERSPETLLLLDEEFEVLRASTRDGTWYVSRDN